MPEVLLSGQQLKPGERLESVNGRFRLELQASDGNLVIYAAFQRTVHDGRGLHLPVIRTVFEPIWATGLPRIIREIEGRVIEPILFMQTDGNLVLRVLDIGEEGVMFKTNTEAFPGSHLELQDDGNLVVYDINHIPRWASNTENRA